MPDAAPNATTAPTSAPAWMWWFVLSAVVWGGLVAGFALSSFGMLCTPPAWFVILQFTIVPVVAIAACVTPLLALTSLLLRRWRTGALVVLGVSALAQLGCVGLSLYLLFFPPQVSFEGWPQ